MASGGHQSLGIVESRQKFVKFYLETLNRTRGQQFTIWKIFLLATELETYLNSQPIATLSKKGSCKNNPLLFLTPNDLIRPSGIYVNPQSEYSLLNLRRDNQKFFYLFILQQQNQYRRQTEQVDIITF